MTSLRAFGANLPPALLVVLLGAFVTLPGLADIPFYTKGEPREGIVIRDMVTKGEWILPVRDISKHWLMPKVSEVPSKPPLFHWLAAAVSLGGGRMSELAIRLPSALLGVLAALVVLRFGSALIGPRAGFLGAVILLTNFQWVNAATSARVDMTLAFFVLVSLMAFYRWSENPADRRHWLYVFYAAMGLAALAKGPVGILLPMLTAFAFLSLRRESPLIRQMEISRGFVLSVAVAGLWYALALQEGGWGFFQKQIIRENLERFLGVGKESMHAHPFYYLPMVLMADMLPWSLFLPALAVALWREHRCLERGHHYLIIWTLVTLVFFSLSAGKRGIYLLPLYPPLGLLVGWWVEQHLRTPHRTVARRAWLLALWAALFLITALFAAALWGRLVSPTPLFFLHHLLGEAADDWDLREVVAALPPSSILVTGLWLTLSWLILLRGVRTDSWRTIVSGITLGMIGMVTAAHLIVYPMRAKMHSYRAFARGSVRHLTPADPLYFYRTTSHQVIFYAQRDILEFRQSLLPPPPDLHPHSHFIFEEGEWEHIRPLAGETLQEVMRSQDTAPKAVPHLVLVRLGKDFSPGPPDWALDEVAATRKYLP